MSIYTEIDYCEETDFVFMGREMKKICSRLFSDNGGRVYVSSFMSLNILAKNESLLYANSIGYVTSIEGKYIIHTVFKKFEIDAVPYDEMVVMEEAGLVSLSLLYTDGENVTICNINGVTKTWTCKYGGVYKMGRNFIIMLGNNLYKLESQKTICLFTVDQIGVAPLKS